MPDQAATKLERMVQRDNGHIGDEYLTELLEATLKTVILVFEVFKRALEDLSEEITESRHEPVVEGGVFERAAEGVDVLLAELFEGSVVTGEEPNSERPEQGVSFQFPAVTLDQPGCASLLAQPGVWKRLHQPFFYHRIRWELHSRSTGLSER